MRSFASSLPVVWSFGWWVLMFWMVMFTRVVVGAVRGR